MKQIGLIFKFALAFLLISGMAVFAQTPTSKTPTASVEKIVLVSDNEADMAVALSVASDLNLPVISTNWGQFKKEALDKIISLSPKEVVIIGGNSAVPAKYSEELVKAGIKTTVIGGKTRQQTSIEVFKKYKTQLKKKPLVTSGKSPILASDKIPVYAYDNKAEIKAFAESEGADATDQAEVKEAGVNAKLAATQQMVDEVKALIQEFKATEKAQGYVLGAKVSAIVKQHGDTVKALVAQKQAVDKVVSKVEEAAKATVKTVELKNNRFFPSIVAVVKGDKIKWVNNDAWAHTVTIDSLGIDKRIEAGETFEYTLSTTTAASGVLEYYCKLHQPYMDGKITVATKEEMEAAAKLAKGIIENITGQTGAIIATVGQEIPY